MNRPSGSGSVKRQASASDAACFAAWKWIHPPIFKRHHKLDLAACRSTCRLMLAAPLDARCVHTLKAVFISSVSEEKWFLMLVLMLILGVNGAIEINVFLWSIKASINGRANADARCECLSPEYIRQSPHVRIFRTVIQRPTFIAPKKPREP